jgi:hypothetical protein
LTFVDVPDVEGPVGVLDDGSLFRPGDAQSTEVEHGLNCPVCLTAISRWGNAVTISDVIGRNHCIVSLRDGRVHRAHGSPQEPQEWLDFYSLNVERTVYPQAVRNRFSKIFVDPQGRLALVSRKSESVISLAANSQLLMTSRRAEIPDKRLVAAFHPAPVPQGVGYSLQVAKWEDGSRAWLDSRGMLHLKSSDRLIPEVTLVLRDGALAGWTSAGWTFGMKYFAGETGAGTEDYVYHNIIEGFVAMLL